ncbi:MAG: hypothetical protein K2Y37_02535 [Pirellulales bacterium]|nr:hypothetical protein [Pirellulales bacterium]
MSESSPSTANSDDLQFQTAEVAEGGAPVATAPTCAVCAQPLATTYYAVGEAMLCPDCVARVNAPPPGNPLTRLLKATFYGLAAGLVGALIWFAIRRVTNYELGLVAILVGFMVGKAVHAGSSGKGGLGYQLLAVVLTYTCIAANYMPDIFEAVFQDDAKDQVVAVAGVEGADAALGVENPADAAAEVGGEAANDEAAVAVVEAAEPQKAGDAVGEDPGAAPDAAAVAPDEPLSFGGKVVAWILLLIVVFIGAMAAPFLMGASNIIGLLIIGFALWEAWKFNARRKLPITGPYQVAPAQV